MYAVKASRWIAPEVMRHAFETMKTLVAAAWLPELETERFTLKSAQKTFVLACEQAARNGVDRQADGGGL